MHMCMYIHVAIFNIMYLAQVFGSRFICVPEGIPMFPVATFGSSHFG